MHLPGFARGGIQGFYNAITDRQFAIDKSRGNFANYDLVNSYSPNPKIICFVRNMPDIFASMEKMYRQNQHKSNIMVNPTIMLGTTTGKRAYIWNDGIMQMMTYLRQSIDTGADKKILFIKYESFCQQPDVEMMRFYNYLEIPPCRLNFDKIEQTVQEDEEVYEYTGLLKIRPSLNMKPSDALQILGEDICSGIMDIYKDYNTYFGYK